MAVANLCRNGTYSVGSATACTVCPSGFACPSTSQAVVTQCSTGTYSTGGQESCSICPAGMACDIYGVSIVPCAAGYYALEGAGVCTACRAGFSCPYTTIKYELPCTNGTYSLGGASSCTNCPPGSSCPSTSSAPQACASGTFSIGRQTSCTVCLAGYSCSSTTSNVMTPCASGYYSLAGSAGCTYCPSGYYCATRSSAPIICPAGSFSAGGQIICTVASPGYFVPNSGLSLQFICGTGYYSNGGASSCTLCNPGYMCPSGSTEPSPSGSECPVGGFCNPANTFTPCQVGTYGVVTAGTSYAQACTACDPGFVCPATGLTLATRTVCPAGGYCPGGSSAMTPCPSGTFSTRTGQISISTCDPCPIGTYCLNQGTVSGTSCPANYYCPEGTSNFQNYPCPAGTYGTTTGLYSASQCTNCTSGFFCPGGRSPIACSAGTYNPYFGGASNSSCMTCEPGYACPDTGMVAMTVPCSPGYYCLAGTTNSRQYACPAGTYSDATNLVSQSGCTQCPAGYTCGIATTTATLSPCRASFYCPAGTSSGNDIACPAGRYSSSTLLKASSECSICPAGSFCSGGQTAVSGICRRGYYCPIGSTVGTQNACPAGTFSNSTGLYASTQCSSCLAGFFCPLASTSMSSCSAGTYSPNNGTTSSAGCLSCPAGYRCAASTSIPVACGVGFYSASGASSCTQCPAGYYCGANATTNTAMLTGGGSWSNAADTAGRCFNGTFCPAGFSRAPDLLRDSCPKGSYCPVAAPSPIPCPAGRYNGLTGQDSLADCIYSPAGFYAIANSTAPNGLCSPGYYCPVSSTGPQEIPCPNRTYLPEYGGASVSDCSTCVAGGYCPLGSANPIACPRGYYCVTAVSKPLPCPPGTYGNATGLTKVQECTACDAGYYCDGYALTAPRGLCEKGFYCISGSNTSTPVNVIRLDSLNISDIGSICPRGSYCPQGAIRPVPCPSGTFNTRIGADSLVDCTSCSPGYYCEGVGNVKPTGFCLDGYYCTGNASLPTQFETQPGYISSAGASNQTACSPGTYNMQLRQTTCTRCPEGFFCPISGLATYIPYPCTAGHYCPPGTIDPVKCPAGTFSNAIGNVNVSQCTLCTPGYYCQSSGLTSETGECDAGYYCTIGSSSRIQPVVTSSGGPCPTGTYCLKGSSQPSLCPRGTYMSSTLNTGNRVYQGTNFFCDLCPNGKACDGIGLSAFSSVVSAGYWSVLGAPTATPACIHQNCTAMYGICPTGSACPANSTLPTICQPGTFQSEKGLGICNVSMKE